MKNPLTTDYNGDLGLIKTAAGDEIEKVYRTLEGKYRAEDEEERLQKMCHDDVFSGFGRIYQPLARGAYDLLSRAPKHANYAKDHANARTAWFRHRKWTNWEAAADKTAALGDGSSPENKNLNYAQKLMAKMRDPKAIRETITVNSAARSGWHEEAYGLAEEHPDDNVPHNAPEITYTVHTGAVVNGEADPGSFAKTTCQHREYSAGSHSLKHPACARKDHHWQGWWPNLGVFVPSACHSCRLLASSFYCSSCNDTVCLACRLTGA
ncbi:hypothetical protein CTA2_8751 [Colletotrichum tanaceti]|uniref:B box-type domain-containing protein n=1 Tax=Colletotrichum tanaceti TaxID=1306861 RepID=A0A4U6XSK6_9PEZI|nr:hypothetical protein CTA2_8751 [Colletotrichum tanaceti]TKW58880.1 hypothetical protein CTA1_8667 [Colletotrichum tanaceti]